MDEPSHTVSTDRCLLRHATPHDYETLLAAIDSPDFPRDLPLANLYRQGKLKAWFDSMIEMSANGQACLFSLDLRTGEKCVGQVSLVRRNHPASWNLAFWLHPSCWGKGLALEAARAIVQHAFTTLRIEEVWAGAALWNQRSIKTLLKLGLTPVEDVNGATGPQNDFRAFSASRDRWTSRDLDSGSGL